MNRRKRRSGARAGLAAACAIGGLAPGCSGYVDPEAERKRYDHIEPKVADVRQTSDSRYLLPCGLPLRLDYKCFATADAFCQEKGLSLDQNRQELVKVSPELKLFAYYPLIDAYRETETLSFTCELESNQWKWWLDEEYLKRRG